MEARIRCTTQVWTKEPSQACLDRFGEPSEPVTADDQHVLEAVVGQFGCTRWPQTSPLSAAWTQIPSTCLTALGTDRDVGRDMFSTLIKVAPKSPLKPQCEPSQCPSLLTETY